MKRKKGLARERFIMTVSSAFVLSALTLAGIYMRKKNFTEEEDYLAKLESVEENTMEVLDQAAKSSLGSLTDQNSFNALFENDMDYLPTDDEISEAGSGTVELGKTEENTAQNKDSVAAGSKEDRIVQNIPAKEVQTPVINEIIAEEEFTDIVPVNEEMTIVEEIPVEPESPQRELSFEEQLVRPVNGSVLIPYSMSASVYFPTLDHYSYNPAQIISAEQGTEVKACADGRVKEIYQDAVLGEVLKMDLGSGYEAVYGQLCNISVAVGDYVSSGQVIAKVQSPTRFYTSEGSNLYFQLKADNEALNPEAYY